MYRLWMSVVLFIFSVPLLAHADINKDLEYAAQFGSVDEVQTLLDAGADVNARIVGGMYDGWTILIVTAKYRKPDTVRVLLEAGADVNAQIPSDREQAGLTALIVAVGRGYFEVVQVLLDAGADVNAKDFEGWTALMHAAWFGARDEYVQTARILLDAGADVNARDSYGNTALMLAEKNGHTAIVDLLKKFSAGE